MRAVGGPLEVCHPTSRAARELVPPLLGVTVLPPRGFVTAPRDFVAWADERRGALRMEDFYRDARRRHGVLMDGAEPAGGRWNLDADNREPPPRDTGRLDVAPAPSIVEDEIDAGVRADLDRWEAEGIAFVGRDGPRAFPATRAEALTRLRHFVRHRLPLFGPYEDAMLRADPFLAHSGLSAAFNLGLLDPMEAVRLAEQAYRAGAAPLSSVEGFVRQLIGWRDYVWHLYWYFDAGYATFSGMARQPAAARMVRRAGRRRGRGGVPVRRARRRTRPRLGAPHPAADGARQLRAAARLAARASWSTGSTAASWTATSG